MSDHGTQTEPLVYEIGIVPCRVCKVPHDYVAKSDRPGSGGTWKAEDGHPYYPMTAEEVVAHLYVALGIGDPRGQ